jgi:hypothetical protein
MANKEGVFFWPVDLCSLSCDTEMKMRLYEGGGGAIKGQTDVEESEVFYDYPKL